MSSTEDLMSNSDLCLQQGAAALFMYKSVAKEASQTSEGMSACGTYMSKLLCLGADPAVFRILQRIPRATHVTARDACVNTWNEFEISQHSSQLYTSLAENCSYSHRDISARLNGGFAAISPSQAFT